MAWPFQVNLIFFIIFAVQYLAITVFLYVTDLRKRWIDEQNKSNLERSRNIMHLPSWQHSRLSIIYVSSLLLIFSSMLLSSQQYLRIYQFSVPILWNILFATDWFISLWNAATFLRLQYGARKNPKGLRLAVIGIGLLCINYLLLLLSLLMDTSLRAYEFRLYFLVNLAIYCIISALQEVMYFKTTYIFVFEQDSSVNAGISEFKKGFVRPFFRGIYCMLKYLTILSLLIVVIIDCTHSNDSYQHQSMFCQYGLPFLLQIWFIALYLTRLKNRPNVCKCCEYSVWRPFIEVFWNIACDKFNERNKDHQISKRADWEDT